MKQLTIDFQPTIFQAAPAFLASALINGDTSGLDADGLATLERVREQFGDLEVVDVARDENGEPESPWFTWSYRVYGGECDGGECFDYVCIRR